MPPCRSRLLPTSPIQSGNCGQHQGTHKLLLIGLLAALRVASSEQNGRAEMPRPCAPNSLLPDWETAVLIFSSKCTGAGCWVPRLGRPVGREVCSPVRASALATLRDRGARSCSGEREFQLGSGMVRRRGGGTPVWRANWGDEDVAADRKCSLRCSIHDSNTKMMVSLHRQSRVRDSRQQCKTLI